MAKKGEQYDIMGGGKRVSPRSIKFVPRPEPGYFDILVKGRRITTDKVVGCLFPERIERPDLMVAVLVQLKVYGCPLALFANGVVGSWGVSKELPKIKVDGTKCSLACSEGCSLPGMTIDLAAVA